MTHCVTLTFIGTSTLNHCLTCHDCCASIVEQVKEEELIDEVSEGHPVAQMYGIGDKWIEFNLTYIAGGADTHKEVAVHMRMTMQGFR